MLDLWLSDVVPGPPDGAPQVVAVTGRMITLTWNPPRSLDMAIGGSEPHRAEWGGWGMAGQARARVPREPGREGKAQGSIRGGEWTECWEHG